MLSLSSWLVAGHLLTSPLNLVDFQLTPGFEAQLPAPAIMPPGGGSDEAVETYTPPRFTIAHGFGNVVPLSFAVKQIIPSMFRVIYRSTADRDVLVSWSGGRPWNQALGSALRQQGLRMVLVGRTVTIGY